MNRTLKIVLIAAVLLMVLGIGAMEYTAQPSFCGKCHEMEEYYTYWQESTHKEVSCMKCHADPGIVGTIKAKMGGTKQTIAHFTGQWEEPIEAVVPDLRCMQCHEDISKLETQSVKFDHEMHAEMDLTCQECHKDVGHAEDGKVDYHEVCGECHDVENRDDCSYCHENL